MLFSSRLKEFVMRVLLYPLYVICAYLQHIPIKPIWHISADQVLPVIISEFVAVLLIVYVYPSAITAAAATVTTGWSAGVFAMWQTIPIFIIIAALVLIIYPIIHLVRSSGN